MGFGNKDQREGGFKYTYKGRTLPSATTIIGGGVPKPALMYWSAKMAAEWAVANLGEVTRLVDEGRQEDAITLIKGAHAKDVGPKARLGTAVHAAAEAHARGLNLPAALQDDPIRPLLEEFAAYVETRELPDGVIAQARSVLSALEPDPVPKEAYVRQFLKFVQDYNVIPVLTERKVFNLEHGYAGTFDSIVEMDDFRDPSRRVNVLLDYKSGKAVYGEVALQLAAYRYAEFYIANDDVAEPDEQTMPAVDACAVVHLRPRSYGLYSVAADERAFRYFRAAKAVYEFRSAEGSLIEQV